MKESELSKAGKPIALWKVYGTNKMKQCLEGLAFSEDKKTYVKLQKTFHIKVRLKSNPAKLLINDKNSSRNPGTSQLKEDFKLDFFTFFSFFSSVFIVKECDDFSFQALPSFSFSFFALHLPH